MIAAPSHNWDQKGYGGLGILLACMLLAAVLYFFIFPTTFHKKMVTDNLANQLCRPDLEPNKNIKPYAPTIMAPRYAYNPQAGDLFPTIYQELKPYRLIKANVPLLKEVLMNYFDPQYLVHKEPYEFKCPTTSAIAGAFHHHFCQLIHEPVTDIHSAITHAEKYAILYPATYSQSTAEKSTFTTVDGKEVSLLFSDYQIIFLLHLHADNTTYDSKGFWPKGAMDGELELRDWSLVDVYQQVLPENPVVPFKPVPDEVIKCGDTNKREKPLYRLIPAGSNQSTFKKELQLDWFKVTKFNGEFNWFFPACKPAIYLYPPKDTIVNVKVTLPNGLLTYTEPIYPKDAGWTVLANPNGQLHYLGNQLSDSNNIIHYPTGIFPYLYYEGKIDDTKVQIPTKGYIQSYKQLENLFTTLLPKLGLNELETQAFKTYWLKALPVSPYYFVGIIPTENLTINEPLTITPKQDTTIRVRLYFEPRNEFSVVQEPEITTPQRIGFTVVDWGGYVKRDKNHPFTCVQ